MIRKIRVLPVQNIARGAFFSPHFEVKCGIFPNGIKSGN